MNFTARRLLRRTGAALLLLLSVLLISCSSLHTVVAEEGDLYRDTKTGTVYRPLPASYEPISRGEEYATLDLAGVSYTLHTVTGLDASAYLCSVWGDVYCERNVDVPDFPAWEISALHLCTNTALTIPELTVKPSSLYSAEMCVAIFDSLRDAYQTAAPVTYPSYAIPTRVCVLRFEADNVKGLYYTMQLLQYGEDIYEDMANADGTVSTVNLGRTFLYDRYTSYCVPVDDVLFRLLDGEKAEDVLS